MTSVNEMNAYQRGKREGYDIGVENTLEKAKKAGLTLRLWKLIIAGVVGFMLAVALEAHALEIPVETTHANSTVQIVENESLVEIVWGAILKALKQ